VEVAEVEQHPGGRRGEAADEIADGERVVAAAPRARIYRREVLDRHGDAKGMRPLEERHEGPLLELGALAEARGRGSFCLREVEAVVGDELGAGGRGVVEQAVEGAVVLERAGAQVVRRVQQQPEAGPLELGSHGARVAQAVAAIGEHRGRRRVDLHPGEAGGALGGEQRGAGPGVAVDVEAEAIVHVASVAVARRGGVARR
jgi:hypothetical protein